MPRKADIITAVKNSNIFLKVPELSGATVKINSNGQPYVFTGGFTMVFQLTKNLKKWAFRVWHTGFNQQKERFQKISQYIANQSLPYFADFIYDEKGLLVDGELVDTIRMEWLEGNLLKKYIETNLYNQNKLLNLANNFSIMFGLLHHHKISHGDLQHGNILIDSQDNIRLIDYDSVCVPEIEGKEELVTGLRGYQHPSRLKHATKASLKSDYFSELIIYLSLCAIAEYPNLWNKYSVKDTEVLLFCDRDLDNLQQSNIYQDLLHHNSDKINSLLKVLIHYLSKSSYLELEPFDSYKAQDLAGITLKMWNYSNQQSVNSVKNVSHSISEKPNKPGKVGFIFSLIALLLCWVPVGGWILWTLGLVFSIIGVTKIPKERAVAGLIMSGVALIVLLAFSVFWMTQL